MLNAGSVVGRILPNFFADTLGAFNLVIPCMFICTGLMFSLVGITFVGPPLLQPQLTAFPQRNATSMGVVAVFYGIASGACTWLLSRKDGSAQTAPRDLALIVALVASLARSPAEIGSVRACHPTPFSFPARLRIGVAFSTNSFAALVGIPIAGVLLTHRLLWTRAIFYSAVRVLTGGQSLP